ncbi:cold-inducible protein YdjO-related protein [Niallia circulans]|jgi:predicted RNA-binding Zn-ribbon protein involved in translation (DUF1610 family)|nr:cold-inducible protein YdjO-related protein [Niallia circulans]MED3839850.1 cold-inducible protein YdjO-related protein [Niallia circulans]MED4241336.1 cold-inducible protein YdjO-related protein [Niallia circulans]MED4247997.1 cold-inducible protein YdjO-related protein [Niallia circulans]MED5099516.1 cold-inducible protein YdjO-related protein [Niallia circulans]
MFWFTHIITGGAGHNNLKRGLVHMFFNRKGAEEKPEEVLMSMEVYACNSCNGWMRKDYATDDLLCPLCGDQTTAEMRELPQISN